MNNIRRRLRTIRIIEKMHSNPETCRKLCLKDVSEFKEDSNATSRESELELDR